MVGCIKPIDQKFLRQCVAEGYTQWISLEEHHQTGGLGSTLLEWLSEEQINGIKVNRIGITDHFVHKLGNQNFVRETEFLNADAIVKLVNTL